MRQVVTAAELTDETAETIVRVGPARQPKACAQLEKIVRLFQARIELKQERGLVFEVGANGATTPKRAPKIFSRNM